MSSHVLLGAVTGMILKRPLLALPVGVASHLVLDSVPHLGGMSSETFLQVAVVDGLLGLTLMLLVWLRARPQRAAMAGIIGAVLLDLDKPLRLVGVDLWPSFIDRIHWGVQTESLHLWWVELLSLLILGSAAVVMARRSKEAGRTVEVGALALRSAET